MSCHVDVYYWDMQWMVIVMVSWYPQQSSILSFTPISKEERSRHGMEIGNTRHAIEPIGPLIIELELNGNCQSTVEFNKTLLVNLSLVTCHCHHDHHDMLWVVSCDSCDLWHVTVFESSMSVTEFGIIKLCNELLLWKAGWVIECLVLLSGFKVFSHPPPSLIHWHHWLHWQSDSQSAVSRQPYVFPYFLFFISPVFFRATQFGTWACVGLLGPWRSNEKKPWTTMPCRPLAPPTTSQFQAVSGPVLLQVPG